VFKVATDQKDSLKRRIHEIIGEALPDERAGSVAAALLMLIEGATLLAQMGQGETAIRDARKAALSFFDQSTAPS
jgi:hypothetical protein